jgi:two-component system sensor histidine kinase BaeS
VTAVSRAEEGQLSLGSTNLAGLVKVGALTAREAFDRKGVRLTATATAIATAAAAETPLVSVDPEGMGQVLGNLRDNALLYTPAGGAVSLTTSSSNPRWVEITVADTGGSVVVNAEARFTAAQGPRVVVVVLPTRADDDSACRGTGKLSHGDAFDVT